MYFSTGIVAIIGGLLCIPGILCKINEKMSDIYEKIIYILGSIGFFISLWGVFIIIHSFILSFSWLGRGWIFYWLTYMIIGIGLAGTGFLLGFGMIQHITIANMPEQMKSKARAYISTLFNVQVPIGCLCFCMGIWGIVFHSFAEKF